MGSSSSLEVTGKGISELEGKSHLISHEIREKKEKKNGKIGRLRTLGQLQTCNLHTLEASRKEENTLKEYLK